MKHPLSIWKGVIRNRTLRLDVARVTEAVDAVAEKTGLSAAIILGDSKVTADVAARWEVWRLLVEEGYAYNAIATTWGCDATTVRNAMMAMSEGRGPQDRLRARPWVETRRRVVLGGAPDNIEHTITSRPTPVRRPY